MDDVVKVNKDNCELLAQRIVDCLVGCVFGITSFHHDSGARPRFPSTLSRFTLYGGYRIVDGYMTIKLMNADHQPCRAITWDLRDESVEVRFSEADDSIIIGRTLAGGKTIFRSIMIFC